MRASLPVLDDLPSGYFVDESPRGILALHVDVARTLHEVGFGPERDGDLQLSDLSGRRPLFQLDSEGERYLIRRFSHGGLARWITGNQFRDPERPFRELILSDFLRRAGILTPQVVAARARMAWGGGWHLDLVSRRVAGTTDLGFVMGLHRMGELDLAIVRRLLRATGQLVRRLHRHGCLHADLTPTNLLVEREALEGAEADLWVIDLDRSRLVENVTAGERLSNLRRLYRYVARREQRFGSSLTRRDYMRFLKAYESDRERRKKIWRAVSVAHKRRSAFHTLGWFFETWLGAKVDPREAGSHA